MSYITYNMHASPTSFARYQFIYVHVYRTLCARGQGACDLKQSTWLESGDLKYVKFFTQFALLQLYVTDVNMKVVINSSVVIVSLPLFVSESNKCASLPIVISSVQINHVLYQSYNCHLLVQVYKHSYFNINYYLSTWYEFI